MHNFITKRVVKIVAAVAVTVTIAGLAILPTDSTTRGGTPDESTTSEEPALTTETPVDEIIETTILEEEVVSITTQSDEPEVEPAEELQQENEIELEDEEPEIVLEQPEPDFSVIPLSQDLVDVLLECCELYGVELHVALGLIECESGFIPDIKAGSCYGLMMLHSKYFPADLSPADNIRTGMEFLGSLIEKHHDIMIALNVYNAGHVTGSMRYSNAVMWKANKWLPILQEANIVP